MRTLRCGRLDHHEPHDWRGRRHDFWLGTAPTTYHCTGYVLTEGAQRRWDDEDDAAEDRYDRDRREASA